MSYPQGPQGPQGPQAPHDQPPPPPWGHDGQAPWPPPQRLSPNSGQGQPGQQWAAEMVAHPHPEPRSYPLMLRTWDYRWWKPLVGIAVGAALFLVIQTLLVGILVIGALVDGGSKPLGQRVSDMGKLDKVTPWSMLYVNLGLASLILVSWVVVRLVHRLRPRWLSSVKPGMRWKFFFICFGLAIVALVASLAVGAVLPHDPNSVSGSAHFPTGQLLATAIVILLTTPLQAMGEEYGFRGYLMQAFGSLTHGIMEALGASKVVATRVAVGFALVMTSTLFALAHGTQNFPLFFDRFSFGLMAGAVVILVGGLEAGIALHILNNLLAFAIAIAYNQLDSTLTVSSASWWQLPVTIVQNGIYLVLVLLVARGMGLRNTTAPPVAGATPQPVG